VQHQDFARSLLPPRKPLSPGFLDGSSSDDSSMSGIQDQSRNVDARSDGAVLGVSDGDYEEDDDTDDDFNVTLRTSRPALATSRVNARPKVSSLASTSKSSAPSRSTALTTVDDGSSLRTRTSSESSVSISISDSSSIASSVAGQKRTLPREHTINTRARTTLKNVTAACTVVNPTGTRVPSHMVTRSQKQILRGLTNPDSLENGGSDEDSDGAWVDRVAPGQKRRRMLGPTKALSVYSTRTRINPQERSVLKRVEPSRSTLPVEAPRVASRASTRVSRRATDPANGSSGVNLVAGFGGVASRRASDKNQRR